jgi:hypothetical protein
MPTTAENVSLIQRRVPNYSRSEILSVMSDLYQETYHQDVEQTLYIDPSTGLPPYLATTDGTYQYNCPSACRRVAQVFSADFPQTYQRTRPVGPKKEYYFRDKGYHSIAVSSRDRQPDGTLATVTFQNNPGDSTDSYYLLYYLYVDPLDTEDDEMILPGWTHRRFRNACLVELRQEDYGQTDKEEVAVERMLRSIRNQLNRGQQARLGQTPVREEYQVYPDTGWYRF